MNKEITPEQEIFDILFENINVQHHIQCNIGYRLSGMREAAEKIASKYGLSTPATDEAQLQKEAEELYPYDGTRNPSWTMGAREAHIAAARKHSVTPVSEQQVSKYLIMDVAAYFNDQWGIEMNEDEVIRVGKMYASHSVTPNWQAEASELKAQLQDMTLQREDIINSMQLEIDRLNKKIELLELTKLSDEELQNKANEIRKRLGI